ncbi:MAG: hypothetical protein ACOY0R_06530, partial [Chloroflexota bacterium]
GQNGRFAHPLFLQGKRDRVTSSPQTNDLPGGLGAPAQRALTSAGIHSLAQLARLTENEVKALHGIGPNALEKLRHALVQKGLAFAPSNL